VEEQYGAATMRIAEKNGTESIPPPVAMGAGLSLPARPRTRHPVEIAGARALLGHVEDGVPDPARAAQIALLRNAVATGRYAPDLHEVARKLLAEVAAG